LVSGDGLLAIEVGLGRGEYLVDLVLFVFEVVVFVHVSAADLNSAFLAIQKVLQTLGGEESLVVEFVCLRSFFFVSSLLSLEVVFLLECTVDRDSVGFVFVDPKPLEVLVVQLIL